MAFLDFINPWGALRQSQRDAARLIDELSRSHADLREAQERVEALEKKLAEALNRGDQHSLTALGRSHELQRLQRLLAGAHFRNPKTGRLGKRGQVFE